VLRRRVTTEQASLSQAKGKTPSYHESIPEASAVDMFSSALKSFSSNITSNYEIGKQAVATSGAWKIFDGKKKSTNAPASIFIFERKSLDVHSSGLGGRASATSIRKVQDEVVERLKKEASSLARLRHPSILQLVEPVEDTRNGGLMFATEPVTASLAELLSEKDDQERSSGVGGRPSRYVVEDPDGTRHRRDLELDELEIQKGLLQIAKGLEFLHESAGLVHGNLTPEAIYVNAKSDWKISGLSFAGPPHGAEGHQNMPPISLSEVLHYDQRLPRFVQLNLDYASPDLVIDTNLNISADIFSLGLLAIALYNFPHASPIQTNGNQSTYKKTFSSASTTPSSRNDFLSTRPLPRELLQTLSRLLARRPAERMTAREFQQSPFFDNILVNTIRFLDALPAKTASEKAQFMRGLGRVMPQFPPSVLGKKILAALLDELKDKELLALILQNIFHIIKAIPSGRRVFPEKVLPRLREVFLTKSKNDERDAGKEAGLMIVLENIGLISENCSAKEFKDDALPLILLGLDSPAHPLMDASLQCLPAILPVLDFSTVKHDLFPVVASVFSKTSSLSIKVRALEAIFVLCGGTAGAAQAATQVDDLSGAVPEPKSSKATSLTALDKFTVQEKVVPLLKGIKTKEPAVMMAALGVFQQVGKIADTDFLAMDVLPILWSFSLGPLLNLVQFKAFMELVKKLSSKIEQEQTRKLQELSSTNRSSEAGDPSLSKATENGFATSTMGTEDDFERLVLGNRANDSPSDAMSFGQTTRQPPQQAPAPIFAWSTADASSKATSMSNEPAPNSSILQPMRPMQPISRSVTPDVSMSSFPSLRPTTNASSLSSHTWTIPALTPSSNAPLQAQPKPPTTTSNSFFLPPPPPPPPPPPSNPLRGPPPLASPPIGPPPPATAQSAWPQLQYGGLSNNTSNAFGVSMTPLTPSTNLPQQLPKQGLDKYQSLL
jgi:SCY1-like protein 2